MMLSRAQSTNPAPSTMAGSRCRANVADPAPHFMISLVVPGARRVGSLVHLCTTYQSGVFVSPCRWRSKDAGRRVETTGPTRAIEDNRIQTESALVLASCPDGRVVGPNCGLLMDRYKEEDFRAHFREESCVEKTEAECQDRYERMISARLETRYSAADTRAVSHTCDAEPAKCGDPCSYESRLRESHNAEIARRGVQHAQDIELARRKKSARRPEDMKDSGGAAAAALPRAVPTRACAVAQTRRFALRGP